MPVSYLTNLACWLQGNCFCACPIDRLLSNSRTSVQSAGVKASPTTGLGHWLPSWDVAPFLHRSIKLLQPVKAAAFCHILYHNSAQKPLSPTLKARKAVFLSAIFSPEGKCWARNKINKWINVTYERDPFFLCTCELFPQHLLAFISTQDAFKQRMMSGHEQWSTLCEDTI